MKEIRNFILRTVLKSIFVGSFLIVIIYIGRIFKNEHEYNQIKKEMKTDSVSPITRSYKPSYNITEDSVFIKRLERSTKELLK